MTSVSSVMSLLPFSSEMEMATLALAGLVFQMAAIAQTMNESVIIFLIMFPPLMKRQGLGGALALTVAELIDIVGVVSFYACINENRVLGPDAGVNLLHRSPKPTEPRDAYE